MSILNVYVTSENNSTELRLSKAMTIDSVKVPLSLYPSYFSLPFSLLGRLEINIGSNMTGNTCSLPLPLPCIHSLALSSFPWPTPWFGSVPVPPSTPWQTLTPFFSSFRKIDQAGAHHRYQPLFPAARAVPRQDLCHLSRGPPPGDYARKVPHRRLLDYQCMFTLWICIGDLLNSIARYQRALSLSLN